MAYRSHVMVCGGTGCVSCGSLEVRNALIEEIGKRGLSEEVEIVTTGCINGFCGAAPLVVVHPEGTFYQRVTPEDISQLVEEHLLKGRPVERLMYVPSEFEEVLVPLMQDVPFFKHQMVVTLRNRGVIDPEKIEDYIAKDGYKALGKVLTQMTPEEVIEEIRASGLRGRGGAGFPTGRKWEACRSAEGEPKYLICNADEGDPGAFMDRSILEADPHSVLEGMVIGAFAVGCREGFIYVRNEYPLALERVQIALDKAREYGLLGEDILGTGFSFDVSLHRGAGAFVCGEESALIQAIEGKPGRPTQRPPFPAQKGLFGKPTCINNVKTWANVPVIIDRGPQWFSSLGTETSKGTMVFSLVGKIVNTGLVEVPMGITLRSLIYDIGGGIPENKRLKAVQTGGPSGGCIPAQLMDLPVDYESLTEAGSMMGSGGMVVMDEDTCMVDLARYFLTFTQEESCGKCTPCREGTRTMLDILTKITQGKGTEQDLVLLEQLANVVKEASLCGLGRTAPNPVLSTLRYFRHEYEAHILKKRCPAAVCDAIIHCACSYECPVSTDIPALIALAAKKQLREAFELMRDTNPFPLTCAYVCHHPCENRCRAGEVKESISIKNLKRYVADQMLAQGLPPGPRRAKPSREEKVAVIGSGPAGLAAAYDLVNNGYGVTVYEASPFVGGMVAAAIPRYRLPTRILEADIAQIQRAGVEIVTATRIGSDLSIEDLQKAGVKAVLVATGAHRNTPLSIEGEDAIGVVDGLDMLKAVNAGEAVSIGSTVAVIGGGNAAIDAARTALRLGAKSVTIVYRRTRVEMPAIPTEVEAGREEGIRLRLLAAPLRILTDGGKVVGLECIRTELGGFYADGRRRPVPVKGSEFTIEVDTVIPAIGQTADVDFLKKDLGLEVTERGTVVADPDTLVTTRAGVFAAGDVVMGPATISDAIGQGKRAAFFIDKYLRGESLVPVYDVAKPGKHVPPLELTDEEIEQLAELGRPEMPLASVAERIRGFELVELGLSAESAMKEASRCLRCDLREA